jgi:hypothetical protein
MTAAKITDRLVDQVTSIITQAGASPASIAALRDAFPGIHFTYCLDDEIGVGIDAFREADGFNLYLVDGSAHCVTFTSSLDKATGLVLAEVSDEP